MKAHHYPYRRPADPGGYVRTQMGRTAGFSLIRADQFNRPKTRVARMLAGRAANLARKTPHDEIQKLKAAKIAFENRLKELTPP